MAYQRYESHLQFNCNCEAKNLHQQGPFPPHVEFRMMQICCCHVQNCDCHQFRLRFNRSIIEAADCGPERLLNVVKYIDQITLNEFV
jgi:hypothetical protein